MQINVNVIIAYFFTTTEICRCFYVPTHLKCDRKYRDTQLQLKHAFVQDEKEKVILCVPFAISTSCRNENGHCVYVRLRLCV